MRITKKLHTDQETILHFLDVFGSGSAALGSSNKLAQPGFFLVAGEFIQEFIQDSFFKKEELLLKALEAGGFPSDEGPVGAMRNEQAKCGKSFEHFFKAAREWQAGDAEARVDVSWGASEFSSTLRRHLDRLKNLIFPLLEQNLTPEEEHKIAEGINNIIFEQSMKTEQGKYARLIEALEEELSDWR